jgi:hypothetical protein
MFTKFSNFATITHIPSLRLKRVTDKSKHKFTSLSLEEEETKKN